MPLFSCCPCGSADSSARRKKWNRNRLILPVFGVENAGKSSLVARLRGDLRDPLGPTIGFEPSTIDYDHARVGAGTSGTHRKAPNRYQLTLYDVGGGPKIRGIWKNYIAEAHAIVYVVRGGSPCDGIMSTTDESALCESITEFCRVWTGVVFPEEHRDVATVVEGKPVLVLVNETADVPSARSSSQVTTAQRVKQMLVEQGITEPIMLLDDCDNMEATNATNTTTSATTSTTTPTALGTIFIKTCKLRGIAPLTTTTPKPRTRSKSNQISPISPSPAEHEAKRITAALDVLIGHIESHRVELEERRERDDDLQTRRYEREQAEKMKRIEEYRREREAAQRIQQSAVIAEGG